MPETAENRTLHRYMVNLPVSVNWESEGSKGNFPAVVRDISEGGFMVVGDAEVPPGAILEFTVGMPAEIATKEEKHYHFRGKVVRLQKTADGKTGFGAQIEGYESVAEEATSEAPVKGPPLYLTRQQEEETQRRKKMKAAFSSLASKLFMLLVAVLLVLGALNYFLAKSGDPLRQQLTGGSPDVRVWVYDSSGLYYCPGSAAYGAGAGRFMSQRDAQLAYHRPGLGKPCE